MNQAVLDIQNVTKQFPNQRGIFDIGFSLEKGDVFGLIGPNGAGKSTLFKILTGLSQADQGQVQFFGHSIQEQYEQAMERVGCLVEKSVAHEHLNALQNLQLAARFYPQVKLIDIEETLDNFGLYKVRHEKVRNFSAGMKQRLCLAGACLSKPSLIILDEPITNLDIDGIVEVRKMIQRLSSEDQVTFLISSHSTSEMEKICNRIGILSDGKLLKTISMNELPENQTLEDFYIKTLQG